MTATSGLVATLKHPVVRGVLLVLTFAFIAVALGRQWDEVKLAARTISVDWRWISAASAVVFATYAMLIQSWRMLLKGWGGHLSYGTAVQIWTISNLGRWIPGKVWQIGAMGVMARQAGVSGMAAAGSALLGTALNIGAGLAIAIIAGTEALDAVFPGLRRYALAGTVLFVVGVGFLPMLLPPFLNRVARWRGLPVADRHLPPRTVWLAALLNAISWIGYGLAFALFTRGVTPAVQGNLAFFITAFALPYLVGYLVLFAPGGIGFREIALSGLLVGLGAAGQGDAAMLGATSRLWLIVLEVLPGTVALLLVPGRRALLRSKG
jgi:glycosyltransferase 2 family protein